SPPPIRSRTLTLDRRSLAGAQRPDALLSRSRRPPGLRAGRAGAISLVHPALTSRPGNERAGAPAGSFAGRDAASPLRLAGRGANSGRGVGSARAGARRDEPGAHLLLERAQALLDGCPGLPCRHVARPPRD